MKKILKFKISGMHCSSCAMNINGELEGSGKIISVSTSYAKEETQVEFDSDVISEEEIKELITKAGYTATNV